ncbi:hypothetical protein KY285_004983 [Solanum tuberosum]|nr:hypothetical protein KY285_004983 [Solanum tuberosum]
MISNPLFVPTAPTNSIPNPTMVAKSKNDPSSQVLHDHDRSSLANTRKKPIEIFREYAVRWREKVARVKPPVKESEMIDAFLEAQEPDYFHYLLSAIGKTFAKVIKVREMVKNGIKCRKIISQAALKVTTQALQNENSANVVDLTKMVPSGAERTLEKLSPSNTPILIVKGAHEDVWESQREVRKTPAQISLLSLLIYSDEHRKAIMNIFKEVRVPNEVTVSQLEKITGRIFEVNRITFLDDELPVEDAIGEIELVLTIRHVDFTVNFQVMNINASYNLLFGKPWVHRVGAVPSKSHQMIKFEYDRQEVIVHSEGDLSVYKDSSLPLVRANNENEALVYQAFEVVVVEHILEGNLISKPQLPMASVMMVNEMLKHGFEPGKGLGIFLQGRAYLVSPRKSVVFEKLGCGGSIGAVCRDRRHTRRSALWSGSLPFCFGLQHSRVLRHWVIECCFAKLLGDASTALFHRRLDLLLQKAKKQNRDVWSLTKPIPPIYKSFIKACTTESPESPLQEPVLEVNEELINYFQDLLICLNSEKAQVKEMCNSLVRMSS